MADTVTLPGIGPAKKQWVAFGAAGAVGVVGYAWWKKRMAVDAAAATPVLQSNDVVPATDYNNPSPGGSSSVSVDGTAGQITTNAEWTQAATTYLANIGWDPKLISSALGKFLQRQGLSADEITAVQTAIGVEGYPPTGGPWSIIPASATSGGTTTTTGPEFIRFTTDGRTSVNAYAKQFNTQTALIWWATQSHERTPQILNDYQNAGNYNAPLPGGQDMFYPKPG